MAAGTTAAALEPAAKLQRKQAWPQREPLPDAPQLQPDREPSLAPTVLVEGAAVPADVLEASSQGKRVPPQLQLQQAAPAAEQQPPVLAQAGPDLFDVLEQAMGVAAAAASGLTPELVAAFAALLLLEARPVSLRAAGWSLPACLPAAHLRCVCYSHPTLGGLW